MSSETFKSSRKLDSLPIGSKVRFEGRSDIWTKGEKGWLGNGSSWPVPWDADTVRGYNANRPFEVNPGRTSQ